jgi:hypothetical protein
LCNPCWVCIPKIDNKPLGFNTLIIAQDSIGYRQLVEHFTSFVLASVWFESPRWGTLVYTNNLKKHPLGSSQGSKKEAAQGVSQPIVVDVVRHLASFVPVGTRFKSPPMWGIIVYINRLTRNVIHEYGEASLGFPCEVFLREKKKHLNHDKDNKRPINEIFSNLMSQHWYTTSPLIHLTCGWWTSRDARHLSCTTFCFLTSCCSTFCRLPSCHSL